MPYGNPFPQITDMKGIAVELPFLRFKYVNIKGTPSQKTYSDNNAASVYRSAEKIEPQAEPVRIDYTQSGSAEISSFGIDPMVSSASVIHELAYGRITRKTEASGIDREYPVPKEYRRHDLDMIV